MFQSEQVFQLGSCSRRKNIFLAKQSFQNMSSLTLCGACSHAAIARAKRVIRPTCKTISLESS